MSAESRTCVETGSLIFAIVNCVIMLVASVSTGIAILYEMVHIIKGRIHPDWDSSYAITAILVAVLTVSSITLTFSILLCKGIVKKRAHYIKAYLMYGAVVLLLIFAAGVVSLLLFAGLFDARPLVIIGCSVLAVCIVYSSILAMIWATYKQVKKEIHYTSVAPLDNKIKY